MAWGASVTRRLPRRRFCRCCRRSCSGGWATYDGGSVCTVRSTPSHMPRSLLIPPDCRAGTASIRQLSLHGSLRRRRGGCNKAATAELARSPPKPHGCRKPWRSRRCRGGASAGACLAVFTDFEHEACEGYGGKHRRGAAKESSLNLAEAILS
jgi:hypothetical protein